MGTASTIDDDTKQAIVGLVVVAGASAWQKGYGRGMEDQADRVGLRYAYEAGYDVMKGPRLWNRFAKKYGEGNKVANFFFSDHSQSGARNKKLEREIAFNYPRRARPTARSGRRGAPEGLPTVGEYAARVPAGSALAGAVSPPRVRGPGRGGAAAPTRNEAREIKAGMTTEEVRAALGDPDADSAGRRSGPPRPHHRLRERKGDGRQVLKRLPRF